MANYHFPHNSFYLLGITTGEATYTFAVDYYAPMNLSFANATVTSTCGGHMYVRLPFEVAVTGNANTDPSLFAQLQINVDNYMASLEV